MPGRARARRLGALIAPALVCALSSAPSAGAAVAPTLHDPANCEKVEPVLGHPAWRCDDGVPDAGGTEPNEGGVKAVTVPAAYQGYAGLPPRAPDATSTPGADANGDIALDVDVTLPAMRAPKAGFPVMFMMHGCCGGSKTGWQADNADASGEKWHYSDSWFASRGYVVVTYTSRGFVNADEHGSTGEMHLQSRDFEINDYQHLACQVLATAPRFGDVTGGRARIDPDRVVVTGGSYGGGYTWMAFTDPRWNCPAGTGAKDARMSVATTAAKYGWTDLPYSLVPSGRHFSTPAGLPVTNGCDTGPLQLNGEPCDPEEPVGPVKMSVMAGLYASGKTGVPPGTSSHTTFPSSVDEGVVCLESLSPPESNPLCENTLNEFLPELLSDSSAYYQNRFFRKIAHRPAFRVPMFAAIPFTDPLFPGIEGWRMLNRLRETVPGYPIKAYAGDFQHFVQNKAREWGDICTSGGTRHVCTSGDHDRGFNRAPSSRVRTGVTTMINRFLDHYARPKRGGHPRRPRFDVTASLQACSPNAPALGVPANEPGPTFRGATYRSLAPRAWRMSWQGEQTTTSKVAANLHALAADPVLNEQTNARDCPEATGPAAPGVAVYSGPELSKRKTMIGGTVVSAEFDLAGSSEGLQLNARLYDVFPGDGPVVMVDRGPRIISAHEAEAGRVRFQLHGNGWRFAKGHRLRLELTQDDATYLKPSDVPATLTLTNVRVRVPVRERP